MSKPIEEIAAALKTQRETLEQQMKDGDESSLTTGQLLEKLRELQQRAQSTNYPRRG
jgi:hypothetical protein